MSIIEKKVQLITTVAITDLPRTRIYFAGYEITDTEFIGYDAEEIPNPEPPEEGKPIEEYQPFIIEWKETLKIDKSIIREINEY